MPEKSATPAKALTPVAAQRARHAAWCVGLVGTLVGMFGAQLATQTAWIRFHDNLHWTSATAAAAVLAWLAWRRSGTAATRPFHFWMMLGTSGYALGQVVWNFQVLLGYAGFPGPADLLYLTMGPCLIVGLGTLLKAITPAARRSSAILDTAMISVAVLVLVMVLYLPRRGDTQGLALLTLVAYPTTLFAVLAIWLTLIPTLRWRVTVPLLALLAGVTGTALSWMRWNFLALDGVSLDGSWFNGLFSCAVLMIGYGLTAWDQMIDTTPAWDRRCERMLRLLPLLVVVTAALTLVLAHHFMALPAAVEKLAVVGFLAVVVLAMLRQAMSLRERDQLIAMQRALSASQKALDLEQTQLQAVLATIPDLIWLKDPEGVYLACNASFERFFGADERDIIGKTDYDFVSKDVADVFRQNDRLAVKFPSGRRNEEHLTFARGGYHGIFETIKTPMRDTQGELVGVLGIARDITERKHAEEQLAIHAGILASLTEGIHLARADTLVTVYVNPQLEQLFGYAPGELIGQPATKLIDPADGMADAMARTIGMALKHHNAWEGDVRNMRKDGTPFWSHVAISTFHHPEHGKVWVSVLADATARKLAEEEVKNLAFYDPLTQLPNRRLMLDRTHQALSATARSGRPGALLMIDLDNFKVLNDTLGHDVGDQMLVGVGRRLVGCVREGDTVARLGGDEFVVILGGLDPGAEGAVQAELVARKIQGALNVPHELTTVDEHGATRLHHHQCSPSIGICMFDNQRLTADDLLKRADTAMYQAKRAGRNALSFYDPAMQEAIELRATLEEEIRRAVFSEQFVLYYQPQVDGDGNLMGAEVLVRWQHPERGMISPAVFVPLAEETGLILPIGHQVLQGACQQLARWTDEVRFADLVLSVNVSARQMSMPNFEQEVMAVIESAGIAPERLKLELTEGLLLTNTEEVIAKMEALRSYGVHFSLDDFGTGYSSLSYLKRLPLDQLKIDQSFVRDLLTNSNDEAIARTVIALGHSLGLHVIAEGVEQEDQRSALRDFGCNAYQGYLFGRPMPVAAFEQLVRTWPVPSPAEERPR